MIKKRMTWAILVVAIAGAVVLAFSSRGTSADTATTVRSFEGKVEDYITATAVVQPQNRLEVNAPIAGRVEKMLVAEGQRVKAGETLALLSSADRAALLDAARLKGGETLAKWQDVYNMTPLLAPIDGEVIVQKIRPGKNVTVSDPVVVLSDRLIVQAQVDETDIGRVKIGQAVRVGLDAYPDISVSGKVDHIYYESTTVNNVTMYLVDIVPDEVPDVFRSGMSASVRIIRESVEKAVLIPRKALKQDNAVSYVLLEQNGKPVRAEVSTGIADGENIQIVKGLEAGSSLIVDSGKLKSRKKTGASPFMPQGRGGRR